MEVRLEDHRISVADDVLDDLRERLAMTRFAEEIPGTGWGQGPPRAFLQSLVGHWRTGYDWRSYEERVNALPQRLAVVDGQPIHLLHVPSAAVAPGSAPGLPLLLLHEFGHWGGEFLDVVAPLTDPPAGAAPAFDLVVPSLPGVAFSTPCDRRGWGPRRAAAALAATMEGLGYERYGVAGHGLGGLVAANLADLRPDAVIGLHLASPPELGSRAAIEAGRVPDDLAADALSAEDGDALRRDGEWRRQHGARRQAMMQLPQSLGIMLEASPAGLAGWVADLWRSYWEDGEDAVAADRLLDAVTTTWVTASATSSARILYELDQAPRENVPFAFVGVPTAVQVFPAGPSHTPRAVVERRYAVARWSEEEVGGGFPPLETPGAFVEDLRRFFASLT